MKREEPETLDLIAAEYVVGTLAGAARRRFERQLARDPFAARRVRAWEDRFALLALRLAPVAPAPGVWVGVLRRIGDAGRTNGWRRLAAVLGVVAVLGFGWAIWDQLRPREPQAVALVASETGAALWRVAVASGGDSLEVEAIGDVDYPDGRSRELWALPEGAAPVSLGLMPASGHLELALDDRQQSALALAVNVAVSDEPVGGSPTGAPTGAVLYVAPLTRT